MNRLLQVTKTFMINKKEYFTLWLYKSALLDFQEQRQAIYVLVLMLLIILSQNWILDWIIIAFIWISYHFYFSMGKTAYQLELQKALGLKEYKKFTFK